LSGIKGIFLISDIYINLGQRPINDIDFLLVNPLNYVDDVTNNLIKNGYVQGYELNNNIIKFSREEVLFKYLTHSTICPFVKYVDGYFVKVDINLYLKGALKRCTNYNIVNIQVLILLTEIYFNQTNLHSIKYSKDIELVKYVDLHYIFQKYSSRDYECLLNSIENNNLLVESRLILGCYLQIFENKLLKETILKRKKWDTNSEQELVKFGNDLVFMWNEGFYERCFDTERYKKVSEENYRLLDNYESTFKSFKEKEKK